MDGVEILSQTTIYEVTHLQWVIPLFILIGALIGVIINIFYWRNAKFDVSDLGIILVLAVIGLVVGAFVGGITMKTLDTVDYIEYKVIVDDSVSLNEFFDKYEILDQEGKIYTVKEKTNDT